ncbi:MAG TPA: NAD(P)H-hydrate dehydratase [Tissierellaceae bacterium]|nr:NAD(P)H-hydrate dehydratase [Tissierellaceae bacterium]
MNNKIKIGVDIVNINRIEKILISKRDQFLNKLFTEKEIKYISTKNYKANTIAGMFASKEAVSKALGSGIGYINWQDIEVLHNENGKPYISINVKLGKTMNELGLNDFEISISHERDYAIAIAIAILKGNNDYLLINNEVVTLLPKRKDNSHKGDYGRVGIISGSTGMTGAPYLTSQSALRTGSGLVYTMVPKSLENIMSIKLTECIIKPIDDLGKGYFVRSSLTHILKEIKNMDAIAIGPGLGVDKDRLYIIEEIIKSYKKPIVLDADAINCLSLDPSILLNRNSPIVITPHPGELGRFLGKNTDEIQEKRIYYSKLTSDKYNMVVVLKGNNTVVTSPNGDDYINTTGNPGMATAGSGDLLTGIILSLIGQGIEPIKATKLGVFVHGLAGDFAKINKGEYGLIAMDILDNIPISLKKLNGIEIDEF